MKKVIEIRDLNFSYPDGSPALNNVNLDINSGETVGIVGPNGAGKSTLLLHLNGLLNGGSGQGQVKILDKAISRQNLPYIRQKVGLVFQDPQDQLFMPTAYEDVAFGPQNLGLSKDRVKELTDYALKIVDLSEKVDHLSYHLSLGEKKRLSIATVLSMSVEIMVLDEPNSNLDPVSRRNLINLLKSFNITKIIATHDLEMVLDLCSRVVVLDKGRVVSDGEPARILSDKSLLESHGLEVPLSLSLNSK